MFIPVMYLHEHRHTHAIYPGDELHDSELGYESEGEELMQHTHAHKHEGAAQYLHPHVCDSSNRWPTLLGFDAYAKSLMEDINQLQSEVENLTSQLPG